tara:strand:- start:4319 stop:5314 length:996 start_codon:yes stop_codon:yes gene_type:complete
MFAKKNKIYLVDNYATKFLLQIILFKKVWLINSNNYKNIFKENNFEIKIFLINEINILNIFSKKFFLNKIFSIKVFTLQKINLQYLREIFHDAGFNEIESRHLYSQKFLSTSLPFKKNKFIINGFIPGNPTFSNHPNPINIYKFASDRILDYPWFSHGTCCGLDEKLQIISHGNHFHRTSLIKNKKISKQIVTINFFLSKQKSTSFSIRFNLSKKSINTFHECIFLKRNKKILFTFTNVINGKLDKVISRFEINDISEGLNSLRIIFDNHQKKLFLFYSNNITKVFSLYFPKYNGFLHTSNINEYRSFNYSIELKKDYFNKIKDITSRLIV